MEVHPTSQYLQIPPRLRLSRQSPSNTLSNTLSNASHGHDADNQTEDDEDNSSTPRRAPLDVSAEQTPIASSSRSVLPEAESTQARLRSLIYASSSATPRPSRPSALKHNDNLNEMNERDTPSQTSSSNTQANIRDLFSRALREPGDTPLKPRRRRSSIGSNAADDSPVKMRQKLARKSLSDDEMDRSISHRDDHVESEMSFKSTQAAAKYDSLRARLSESSFAGESSRASQARIDPTSPPAATSTPLKQSISTFPIHLSASNLLNDDSNMRRAMRDLGSDTSEEDHFLEEMSETSRRANSDTEASTAEAKTGGNRRKTLSRLNSTESADHLDSRPTSRQGDVKSNNKSRTDELERGWNRPLAAFIDRHKTGSVESFTSGNGRGIGVRRQGSAASLRSLESNSHGRSSPSPSISSQSDHSSHAKEVDEGKETLRTNGVASSSRPSSTSPAQIRAGGRSRTLSHPVKPASPPGRQRVDSLTSTTPRERPVSSLSQHRSSSSLHYERTPSRASSTASSITHSSEADIQHERERNWNSARPNWSQHSGSPSHGPHRSQEELSHSRHANGHARRGSSPSFGVSGGEDSAASSKMHDVHSVHDEPARYSDAQLHSSSTSLRLRMDRSKSSLASSNHVSKLKVTAPTSPRPSSRARLSPPLDRSPNPQKARNPTDSAHHSPRRHRHQSDAGFTSHIPVRSNLAIGKSSLDNSGDNVSLSNATNDGAMAKKVSVPLEPITLRDSDWETNDDDDAASLVSSVHDRDSDGLLNVPQGHGDDGQSILKADQRDIPQASPPSSPKHNSYKAVKSEFTPVATSTSLPDLPSPPSSGDDDDSDRTPRTPVTINRGKYADAKTPRPPGAWSTPYQTPAQVKSEDPPMIDATPTFEVHNEQYTPPASLSRATSLAARTPAPPGAWMVTPGVIDKRKAQKVRFGGSSTPGIRLDQDDNVEDVEKQSVLQSLDQTYSSLQSSDDFVHATSSNGSTRSPRRSSSIRVVDAFGKEISGQQNAGPSDASVNPFESGDIQRSPSNRKTARIRVVNAMGKAIDGEVSQADADDEIRALMKGIEERNMNNQQARDLIAKTIAELKSDVDRFPLASNTPDSVDDRVAALNEQINSGSEKRRELQHALASAQKVSFPTTHKPRVEVPLKGRWFPVSSKLFALCVVVQVLICFVLYRIVSIASQNAFLTTYVDPFNPELYLHITNPEIFRTLTDSPDHVGRRIDWTRYAFRTLHNFVDHFLSVQDVWYPWSNPSRSVAWPPT